MRARIDDSRAARASAALILWAACIGPPDGRPWEAPRDPDWSQVPPGAIGEEWPADEPLPTAFEMPPWVTMPEPNHIVIGWRTAWDTAGSVRFGDASVGYTQTLRSPSYGQTHHVDLGVLPPATRFAFEVVVIGSAGSDEVDAEPGATRAGSFVTPGRDTWRFVHLAETHAPSDADNMAAFAGAIRKFQPQLVVESGDMVDAGSQLGHWRSYLRAAAPWISNVILLPAHSNHVNGFQGNPHVRELFALPGNGRWYVTRYGQVEVFTLDSTYGAQNPDIESQGEFIRERLATARDGDDDPAFVIGAWHYPACSSHYAVRWHERVWVRDNFVAAFSDEGGLDLALVGHDKYYERSRLRYRDGGSTLQVMTNAGRLAPSTPSAAEPACEPIVTDIATRSIGLFEVSDAAIEGLAIDLAGETIDVFTVPRREIEPERPPVFEQ